MYQCLTVTEGLYLLDFLLQGFLLQSISYPITQVANKVVYHHFVVIREGLGKEWEGTIVPERWETQEAGVATSEVLNESGEVPGSGCEGTKDWGEGLSSLSAADKGKGKEKEVVEETLQEE